jgi:hypothetical protein
MSGPSEERIRPLAAGNTCRNVRVDLFYASFRWGDLIWRVGEMLRAGKIAMDEFLKRDSGFRLHRPE